jgi:hypothetical protein
MSQNVGHQVTSTDSEVAPDSESNAIQQCSHWNTLLAVDVDERKWKEWVSHSPVLTSCILLNFVLLRVLQNWRRISYDRFKKVTQYARKKELCLHLSLKMWFHLHCLLTSFICMSCQTATMCTYINIKVQPQETRAAELWLLPQVSADPGPCPSESTILNGRTPWKEFPSVQNYGEFLVSAHLT